MRKIFHLLACPFGGFCGTFNNKIACLISITGTFHRTDSWVTCYRFSLSVPPDLASALSVVGITEIGATVKWTMTPQGTPATFDSYEVTISPSVGTNNISPNPLSGNSPNPEVTVTGLKAGVQYTVSVRTQKGSDKGNTTTVTFNASKSSIVFYMF
jgi:hypothetical protein